MLAVKGLKSYGEASARSVGTRRWVLYFDGPLSGIRSGFSENETDYVPSLYAYSGTGSCGRELDVQSAALSFCAFNALSSARRLRKLLNPTCARCRRVLPDIPFVLYKFPRCGNRP